MEKVVTIKNKSGLHARPAGRFVKEASKFRSDVMLNYKGKIVNAKSIMGVMSLGLSQGEEVTITTDGIDEDKAIEAMVSLVEADFGEQ
ncbi:MAG: HPr family phosphocarrier protein [Clostridioides sp.]|jgi:phosphocarrier protein|nr:HPr family phosphocarrier protein [Clostridioides sp.]